MHTLSRPLLGAAAALAVGLSAIAPAAASADPAVQTTPATAVTDTTATLNGVIGPQPVLMHYTFEYGVTTQYELPHTPISTLPPPNHGPRNASATVSGLTPGTVYHFRVLAGIAPFFVPGDDQTFTTAPAPAAAAAAPAPAPLPAPEPVPAPAPPAPVLGQTVGVAPVSGTVTVKVPGASGFVTLGAGATIPSGATVDTRAGEVALTTALPGGKTQTAQFHGGVFRVRQTATSRGVTDIDLRGPALACGSSRGGARAAAVRTKRRKLWGSDKGGRFRTHGRNSVATVRGTKWVTTDTCAGTRTTVTEGAVSVRDTHRHRTVLVRAGHSYVARSR